jgi:hypothetical protein
VHTVFGVIEFLIFIPLVISLAAGVTWLVVKLSPPTKETTEPAKPASS